MSYHSGHNWEVNLQPRNQEFLQGEWGEWGSPHIHHTMMVNGDRKQRPELVITRHSRATHTSSSVPSKTSVSLSGRELKGKHQKRVSQGALLGHGATVTFHRTCLLSCTPPRPSLLSLLFSRDWGRPPQTEVVFA